MARVYCLRGRVHLSLPACERFLKTELDFDCPIGDILDECRYENDALFLRFEAEVCSEDDLDLLDDLLEVLAAAKDTDVVDELQYADSHSQGCYYIRPGRWAYVSGPNPSVPPDDSPLWQTATIAARALPLYVLPALGTHGSPEQRAV